MAESVVFNALKVRTGILPLVASLGVAFLLLLLILPAGVVVWRGLADARVAFGSAGPWPLALFTYGQAVLSAVLSGVVGTAGAFVQTEMVLPGRRWIQRFALLSFSLPTLLGILALSSFWGRNGVLLSLCDLFHLPQWSDHWFGWFALLLAHVFFNAPLFLRAVSAEMESSERTEEKIALSLGASRGECLRITLRKIRPVLVSQFLLSLLFCSTSFLTISLLGGSPQFTTLELAIYHAIQINLDIPRACYLAIWQLGISLPVYFILSTWFNQASAPRGRNFIPIYFTRGAPLRFFLAGTWFIAALLLWIGPLLFFFGRTVAGIGNLPLADLGKALWGTTVAGMTCVLVSVFIGMSLVIWETRSQSRIVRRIVLLFSGLPLCFSPLLLSFAWYVCFRERLEFLQGSLLAIGAVQGVAAVPLSYRPLADAFREIPLEMRRSVTALGADSFYRFFWLELPLAKGAIVTAALFSWGFSLGEVGAALMFSGVEIETLALALYRAMGKYDFSRAYALGGVLLIWCAILMGILHRVERE